MADSNPKWEEPKMDEPVKRLRYFTGQFLEQADFLAEQHYHSGLRRRGNRALYFGAGILDGGFQLAVKPGDDRWIVISRGVGIDGQGRELVLVADLEEALKVSAGWKYVTLCYYVRETNQQVQDQDVSDNTRYEEKPVVGFRANLGDFDNQVEIVIGRIQVDGQGRAVGAPDLTVRQMARARTPGGLTVGQGGDAILRTRHVFGKASGNDADDALYLNWNNGKNVVVGNLLDTASSLLVSGNVGIGTATPGYALHVRTDWGFLALDTNDEKQDAGIRLMEGGVVKWHLWNGAIDKKLHLARDGLPASLTVDSTGRLGVGTTGPQQCLSVGGGANIDQGNANAGSLALGLRFGSNSGEGIASRRTADGNQYGLDFYTRSAARLSITNGGNVGIGTTTPGAPLTVAGPSATTAIESEQVLHLLRPGVASVKNSNCAGLYVGSYEQGISGSSRLDIKLAGFPDGGNQWGTVPNVTVMTLQANGNVGIGMGSSEPKARLQVSGGAIMPEAGNTDAAGILFPSDPGGGGGDKAWIRYYARTQRPDTDDDSAERTALELGVANDSFGEYQDDILLMPSGGVGVGTREPTGKLHIYSGNEHAAVISVAGTGKALAITTDSNIAYTQGRAMKKVLGGGEFKLLNYDARCSPSYDGPYLSSNRLGCSLQSGQGTFYSNFNLPLNAKITGVRIRLDHRGFGVAGAFCTVSFTKTVLSAAGWTAFPVFPANNQNLSLAPAGGSETISLPMNTQEKNRTVLGNDENFAVEINVTSPNANFYVNWVEVSYTLYDILVW
jgi:hypothetical protein